MSSSNYMQRITIHKIGDQGDGIARLDNGKTAYIDGVGVVDPQIPQHEDIPPLLNKVLPIHEAVHIDYFLPGCPPPADAFWELLTALIENREPNLDYAVRHFD